MTDIVLAVALFGLSICGWAFFTYKIVKLVVVMKLTDAGYDAKKVLLSGNRKNPTKIVINDDEGSARHERMPDDLTEKGLENLRRVIDGDLGAVDEQMNEDIDKISTTSRHGK